MARGNRAMTIDLPERDAEGYLTDPGDWNEDVARPWPRKRRSSLTMTTGTLFDSCATTSMNTRSSPMPVSSSSIWPLAWGSHGERCAQKTVRTLPLRLREACLQDCRHAAATGMEHRLTGLVPDQVCICHTARFFNSRAALWQDGAQTRKRNSHASASLQHPHLDRQSLN